MNIEKIKENLNLHRLNKNLLWNALLLTTGGTIGLIVKLITSNNSFIVNIIFTVFIILGVAFGIILFKLQQELSKEIFELINQLEKKEN